MENIKKFSRQRVEFFGGKFSGVWGLFLGEELSRGGGGIFLGGEFTGESFYREGNFLGEVFHAEEFCRVELSAGSFFRRSLPRAALGMYTSTVVSRPLRPLKITGRKQK